MRIFAATLVKWCFQLKVCQGDAVLRCMIVCKSGAIKVNIQFEVGKIIIKMETGAFSFSWTLNEQPFIVVKVKGPHV